MRKYINTNATSALPLLSSWVPSMSYTAPTTLYDYWGMVLRMGLIGWMGIMFKKGMILRMVMILRIGMILRMGMILSIGTVMILVSFIYKLTSWWWVHWLLKDGWGDNNTRFISARSMVPLPSTSYLMVQEIKIIISIKRFLLSFLTYTRGGWRFCCNIWMPWEGITCGMPDWASLQEIP